MYKWVDENGQTRFSDKPPAQNKFQTLNMPSSQTNMTSQSSNDQHLEKQKKLLQAFDEERHLKAKSQQEMTLKKRELAKNCTDARNHLEYISTGVLYRKDNQGEHIYYTEEERTAKQKELQLFIQRNCQ